MSRFSISSQRLRIFVCLLAVVLMLGGFGGFVRPAHAQVVCTPNHVVQPGENLFRIALSSGVTWTVLAQINGIVDPNLIYVGEVLCLPGSTIVNPPVIITPVPPIIVTPLPPVIPPSTGVTLPPPNIFPTISLSTYSATPGQTITITGINFPTNSVADVFITPLFSLIPYAAVAQTTTSPTGTVNFAFTIPTVVNGGLLQGAAFSVLVKTQVTGYYGFNFFYNSRGY